RELPRNRKWLAENPLPHVPTVDLFRTVSWGRPDLLREAIAAGGDVNHRLPSAACPPARGGTPLSWAAATGRMDLVGPPLEAGAARGVAHPGGAPPGGFRRPPRSSGGRRGAAAGSPPVATAMNPS